MEPHLGSVDTLKTLERNMPVCWPTAPADQWERFGFLGVFADYALNSVAGDVLEIGVGESSVFLGRVAWKHRRRIYHCDISPSKILNPMSVPGYLVPPGCEDHVTYFEERDPTPQRWHRITAYGGASDDLFKRVPVSPLAVSFIDGDHLVEQARKDFNHVFARTVENGFILLHDTYPPDASWTDENHCGDVWKLRQEIERRDDCDCLTLTRGTALGVGLTIVRKKRPVEERQEFQR